MITKGSKMITHRFILITFWIALISLLPAARALAQKRARGAITVAVLGDSRTDGCAGQPKVSECRKRDNGFDARVLGRLLGHAAAHRPADVFFTGDLTLGYEKEETDGAVDPGATPAAGG